MKIQKSQNNSELTELNWSVVFINVLNSMAGIGIGICLGISFGISGSLIFSKKDKDK